MKVLNGKVVAFLGDSITAGAITSAAEKEYVNVFADLSGAKVYTYGICGTRIAKQIKPSENVEFDKYFASRVPDMVPNADLVFVFGGTNDFGHGDAPLGKIGDTSPDTFYGAVYDLFLKLRGKYPLARIFLITPLHRSSENDKLNEWGLPVKKKLREVVDAEKEVAQKFSVSVIDLYGLKGFSPVLNGGARYFSSDGLHPNDVGHKLIAETIYDFVLKEIKGICNMNKKSRR